MSLKTLISAAVLLGSSTAALAQPAAWSQSHVRVRDHRSYQYQYAPAPMPAPTPVAAWDSWSEPQVQFAIRDSDEFRPVMPAEPCGPQTIATFDRAFDTRQQGPIAINVGSYIPNGKLIVTSTGNSEVFAITVYYADGTSHKYLWNHLFNAPTSDGQAGSRLVMSGTGKAITRVVLDGYNAWNTEMAVQIQSQS